jgi:hypothetical protein
MIRHVQHDNKSINKIVTTEIAGWQMAPSKTLALALSLQKREASAKPKSSNSTGLF